MHILNQLKLFKINIKNSHVLRQKETSLARLFFYAIMMGRESTGSREVRL
nr:MAG TPA: hypothetical protein [Caudoviricetes sp.]